MFAADVRRYHVLHPFMALKLRRGRIIPVTSHSPVQCSWASLECTPSFVNTDSASLTNTLSSTFAWIPVIIRPIPELRFLRVRGLPSCRCRSASCASRTSLKNCCWSATLLCSPPPKASSSFSGWKPTNWVRGSSPSKRVSGMVRWIHTTTRTYVSNRRGYVLNSSFSASSNHLPSVSAVPCARAWSTGT